MKDAMKWQFWKARNIKLKNILHCTLKRYIIKLQDNYPEGKELIYE